MMSADQLEEFNLMQDFPLISVIVPVFNVNKYLHKCLDSILAQTYQNYEIILVDDGSTDGSAAICDAYKENHGRITVRHKANGGLISARKCGIAKASGEYICFVDADDWVEPQMIEELMQMNKRYQAEMIAFGCVEDYGSFSKTLYNSIPNGFYDSEWMKSNRTKLFAQENYFSWVLLPHLWNKLIHRKLLQSVLNNVPEDISFGEDVANVFPCLQRTDSLLVVNYPYYHYVQRKGSIVNSREELSMSNFQGLYKTLLSSFCNDESLMKQLKEYLFFALMLKKYSSLDYLMPLFPFEKVQKNDRVFIYCAGGFGSVVKDYIDRSDDLTFAGWSDSNFERQEYYEMDLIPPDNIFMVDFDVLIVSILNQKIAEDIVTSLLEKGIPKEKIDYIQKSVIDKTELPEWVSNT